jgi:hypothetical protein
MSQVSFDTLLKIALHVSYAVVPVKDYGKRAKSHGDLLQAALALFPNSEKGGLSHTSLVGASSATQVSAMQRLTALHADNRTWGTKPLRARPVPFLKGHKSWIAALTWASKLSGVLSIMVLICRMIALQQEKGGCRTLLFVHVCTAFSS